MIDVASANASRFGPALAGFLTPKSLDSVTFLVDQPELCDQLRSLLMAAEHELFAPLLKESKPSDFTQQFEYFANRYLPIRLQVLINLANAIGADRLRAEYFQKIPGFLISLAQNANNWGLQPAEVAESFDHYFSSAQKIASIAPHLVLAPPETMLRLLSSISEVDFGFTALGLVFEGSIVPMRWAVHEIFKLTRRSLLVYQDATEILFARLESVRPEQVKMDFDAAYHAAVVNIASYKPEPDEPPSSDKRSGFRNYNYPKR